MSDISSGVFLIGALVGIICGVLIGLSIGYDYSNYQFENCMVKHELVIKQHKFSCEYKNGIMQKE